MTSPFSWKKVLTRRWSPSNQWQDKKAVSRCASRFRLGIRRDSFIEGVVIHGNVLLRELGVSPSLEEFRKRCDTYWHSPVDNVVSNQEWDPMISEVFFNINDSVVLWFSLSQNLKLFLLVLDKYTPDLYNFNCQIWFNKPWNVFSLENHDIKNIWLWTREIKSYRKIKLYLF